MNTQKIKNNSNSNFNPLTAAAITGAVVGAGVAVAGAVALKDENNRKKAKAMLNNVKDRASGYMENIQKTAEEKKLEIEKIAKKNQKRISAR